MLVPNVVFLIFAKLEMITSLILLIAKLPLPAPLSLEELPKMSLMRWREIFMIVLESPKTSIPILDLFQEEELRKCKFPQELIERPVNMKALNNFLLEPVHYPLFSWLCS